MMGGVPGEESPLTIYDDEVCAALTAVVNCSSIIHVYDRCSRKFRGQGASGAHNKASPHTKGEDDEIITAYTAIFASIRQNVPKLGKYTIFTNHLQHSVRTQIIPSL